MAVTEPTHPIPDAPSDQHDGLRNRIEFEYLKTAGNSLGIMVAVIFGIVALLHQRMLVAPEVDFGLLFFIWIMLAVAGAGLWVLVARWKRGHPLPSTPAYSGEDPVARALDDRRRDLSREARRHSEKRQHWVVGAALLSPLAVLSLSVEMLLLPSGNVAVVLILLEIVILGLALTTVYVRWPFGKAHETWVPARLRAELLRRELFLYRARVGPYLDRDDRQAHANKRIREIAERCVDGAEEELLRLTALLNMEQVADPAGGPGPTPGSWSDALEDSFRRSVLQDKKTSENDSPDAGFDRHYLTERVRAQKTGYFGIQKELHEGLDVCWEIMSLLTLWSALAVAFLHFGIMMGRHDAVPAHPPPFRDVERWVEVFALALPPLGAFFIALRTQFEDHRLSRSYDDQFWQLDRLEKQMEKQMETAAASQGGPEIDLQIKRLVLQTEMLLSHEVRRWWHIVGPEIPKGS